MSLFDLSSRPPASAGVARHGARVAAALLGLDHVSGARINPFATRLFRARTVRGCGLSVKSLDPENHRGRDIIRNEILRDRDSIAASCRSAQTGIAQVKSPPRNRLRQRACSGNEQAKRGEAAYNANCVTMPRLARSCAAPTARFHTSDDKNIVSSSAGFGKKPYAREKYEFFTRAIRCRPQGGRHSLSESRSKPGHIVGAPTSCKFKQKSPAGDSGAGARPRNPGSGSRSAAPLDSETQPAARRVSGTALAPAWLLGSEPNGAIRHSAYPGRTRGLKSAHSPDAALLTFCSCFVL
jgi:hypothetical protein